METEIELSKSLKSLKEKANEYFSKCIEIIPDENESTSRWYIDSQEKHYYWNKITDELRNCAELIIKESIKIGAELSQRVKRGLLTSEADEREVVKSIKVMRASILFRRFSSSDTEVIHDEGMVLGVQPAQQNDDTAQSPTKAKEEFDRRMEKLWEITELLFDGFETGEELSTRGANTTKYRPGTAFVMMSMDKTDPGLSDVLDAVKTIFKEFGIDAVRADDIEHDGQITSRVITEIETSEFLFADLTGERPNVYYEVGYAHALKKRVMLFRKKDTNLHFDLADYNCKEYENLRELREHLSNRLREVTNKEPKK